jgi:cytidylate kinase
MQRVVTIDGPAGAGKSTVARQLAERLGWSFLDTGAMYRAVTLAALRSGIDLTNEAELASLMARVTVTIDAERVFLADTEVTHEIREPEVTEASRFVADSPSVRARLVALQRQFADGKSVVTEGRDQGTVVFPTALRKYYLTASPEERARRRVAQQQPFGNQQGSYESVLQSQRERDERDAARPIGAMKPAEDSRFIDSTGKSIAEVVEWLTRDIEQGLAGS